MMRIVESLAKPASTLIAFASIGSVDNQSVKIPVDKSFGLMSSLIRILKRSLGYSESDDIEVAGEAELLRPLDRLGLESAGLAAEEFPDCL